MHTKSTTKLNDGNQIPLLGLGTYESDPGNETKQAVLWALEVGYRHIDTAQYYGNEKSVGEAIKESGIPREEIFITTKLTNDNHGFEKSKKSFEKSLENLDTNYIDLFLVHWPVVEKRLETWKASEELVKSDKLKSIGVSNYMIRHLEELKENAEIMPVLNQVEFSPYLYQKELLKYCQKNNIQLEAYSPLTRGEKLDDPKLIDIAKRYAKTTAQILIRWAIQHEIVVIPKSVHKDRIEENAEVFDFEIMEEDMKKLDNLNEEFRTCWDPTTEESVKQNS